MLAIGAIELLALLTGFSASGSLESALPEIADPEIPDLSGAGLGPLSHTLGWLSVGKLPILALLVIFLTAFGLTGYIVQWVVYAILGVPLSGWIASVPAVVSGVYAMRYIGRWLARIFPRDHSEAASQQELIGAYATILRGEAAQGKPAEAKTQDLRGRSHYVLIEPDEAGITYQAGQRVFIVSQTKNIYRAVTRLSPGSPQ